MSSWAWIGWEYKGTLTNQTDANACYGAYQLRLHANAYAGSTSVTASVMPSISGIEATSVGDFFQADADARVELEKFSYHSRVYHHHGCSVPWHFINCIHTYCPRCIGGGHCVLIEKQKEVEEISDALVSITISDSSETTSETLETAFSISYTFGDAAASSESRAATTNSQTVSGKTARVRSLELDLGDDGGWLFLPSSESILAFFGNSVLEKQPKNASAQGKKFYSDNRETKKVLVRYAGHDTHRCTTGNCPTGECPTRM